MTRVFFFFLQLNPYVSDTRLVLSYEYAWPLTSARITHRVRYWKFKMSKLYHDRSVGWSVLLSDTHLGPKTRYVNVRHSRVCWCGVPSLTRWRICSSQLQLVPVSSVLLGFHDNILLSKVPDSPPSRCPGPNIFIPQHQSSPVIPSHWILFSSPPTAHRSTAVLEPTFTWALQTVA
jgi:hypothetical protein